MHKTHVKDLTHLIKEAFALTADDYIARKYVLKVIDGGPVGIKKHKIKFIFFPGLSALYREVPAPLQGDALYEVAITLGRMLDEVFSDSQYTYKNLTVDFRDTFSMDPYIEGSFIVGNIAQYAGRASDLNHEIDILVRKDKKVKIPKDASIAHVGRRRKGIKMPSKNYIKNPDTSVLGALILGGIIGHSMKKK